MVGIILNISSLWDVHQGKFATFRLALVGCGADHWTQLREASVTGVLLGR
jgi:hypothetical protein